MINNVTLLGRITHDLELKNTPNGVAVLAFTMAVDRGYTKQGEERQADFIRCVAWKQRAVFIEKHFKKGSMIAIEGRLQTRTYDDLNNVKHFVTEVIVSNISFTGERNNDNIKSSESKDIQEDIGDIDDFEVVISDEGTPF